MRIMFMGTPEIAVSCFEALTKKHEVCCVVTKTDKPKGRGKAIAFSAVKEKALQKGIDIIQPTTLKDGRFIEVLEKYKPDVIVVVAFGLILPKYVLDYPRFGCINLHVSLLPKYRGAAPIQWCIARGEKVGGITTMLMDEGLDTGDILLKSEVLITPEMTAGELHDIYCERGADLLLETLDRLEKGTITPEKQDDSAHTYAPMLTNDNTRINWSDTAENIINLVRGMNPYPTAHTVLSGKKLKVYHCHKAEYNGNAKAGTVVSADGALIVACGDGAVSIDELALEGKKRMRTADFLRGYKVGDGTVLG
ncbi:MAG: Methionyl-tRNA formyltransferase [Firmicutes bacterium ADurb.Bin193]|nr:MAG: Methionyl-tRNA formyltransferase [Firmicutes bacterium ADurb.Bin193]